MGATVTLSVEVELGWGVHDLDAHDEHLSDDGRAERRYLRKFLAACDDHGVPVTFDVVGHLLLASCSGHHEGPYPDGWFDADPGTDVARDPLFYAPDMVEAIRERTVEHDLCTHSFSHAPCDPVDPSAISADLARAQQLHEDLLGDRTRAYVPPRHRPPPSVVLRDNDIDVVRHYVDDRADSPPARFKQLLFGPPPMREPDVEDGILWTYGPTHPNLVSPALPSGQRPAGLAFRWIPTRLAQRLHRQYLERATMRAVENDEHLHLWCHLYDFANEYQLPPLVGYLRTLEALQRKGDVEVRTMTELADDRVPIER